VRSGHLRLPLMMIVPLVTETGTTAVWLKRSENVIEQLPTFVPVTVYDALGPTGIPDGDTVATLLQLSDSVNAPA